MPAPKGNEFYKIALANGNLKGRPALFTKPEQVAEKWNEYRELMEKDIIYKADFIKSGQNAGEIINIPCRAPYTIEGFCLCCGITSDRFNQMLKDENYKDLFGILTHIKEAIRNDQIKGGLVGTFNPMLVARIQGLKEQTETTGQMNHSVTQINFIKREIQDTTFQDVSEADDSDL